MYIVDCIMGGDVNWVRFAFLGWPAAGIGFVSHFWVVGRGEIGFVSHKWWRCEAGWAVNWVRFIKIAVGLWRLAVGRAGIGFVS